MELVTGCEVVDWKVWLHITILYPAESGGRVPMKPLRKRGGRGIATTRQQSIYIGGGFIKTQKSC